MYFTWKVNAKLSYFFKCIKRFRHESRGYKKRIKQTEKKKKYENIFRDVTF